MKQSRINLLQQIYDHEKVNSSPLSIPADTVNRFDISYLETEGYIVQPLKSVKTYHLSLTEKGESFVVNGFLPSTPVTSNTSFNFSNTTFENSVVGTNVSNVNYTLNTGAAFSELQNLIESKQECDREQLNQLVSVLQSVEQSSQPVKKGILVQFSDLLNKYSDLIVPVGKILIGIFSSS